MTELQFDFWAGLSFQGPVTAHRFALRCLPIEDEVQSVQSVAVRLAPQNSHTLQRDGFGNWLVCGSCEEPHDSFEYGASGIVQVDLARRAQNPCINPALRYPTALTAPSGPLRALWQSLPLQGQPPCAQAQVLCHAAAAALQYTPGATGVQTTAAQALALGQGVCQDYAHLLLALARLSGFAARYCMGLIPGEGATHAWVELALPGGWAGFDPTHDRAAGEDYLRFATGRDAADCAAERGVFRGPAGQTQRVDMRLRRRA